MKISKLLNVFGMMAAFAALYIILVQVHYDLTFNRGIKDSDRIYAMAMTGTDMQLGGYINRPMAEEFINASVAVEAYGVAQINDVYDQKWISVVVGEGTESKKHYALGLQMTNSAFEVFGIKPTAGSLEGIGNNEYVALSRSAAERMGVAVGDLLHVTLYETPFDYTICAIFEDLPMATDLGEIEMIYSYLLEEKDMNSTSNWSYNYFVKLRSKEDKAQFEEVASKRYVESMRAQIERYRGMGNLNEATLKQLDHIDEVADDLGCQLVPIRELYFEDKLDYPIGKQGNVTTTVTLLVLAVLIVIITLINYVNFFFAQVPMRIRAVNTRKILGSSRAALVGRFLAEAAGLVAVALVLAVGVVMAFRSSEWAHFVDCDLSFAKNIIVALSTIGIAMVMTLAAGLYPAMYATSFSPAFVIKGSFGMTQKGKTLRYALIGLQFVISIVFIMCAIFLKEQHRYMMTYDMGFDKECLISASGLGLRDMKQREAFTSELMKNPNIKDVAWAQCNIVTNNGMTWGRWHDGEQMMIRVLPVSWNFLQFMGVEVFEGRDFLPSDELGKNGAIILNEYAKKRYNLTMEDQINWSTPEPLPMIGFCRDIHYLPLQYESEAFAFLVYGEIPYFVTGHLYVRTIANADIRAVFDAIRTTTQKIVPDRDLDEVSINFFDEELGYNYQKEQQLTTTISLFTLLAIIISLMGVLGLVLFETQYRRKEIGIRRVNGATVREILLMFNRKFVVIVAICFIIAAPISYFITDYYYSTFAYRAPIHWWVFVVALLAVLFVTTLVVTLATFRTASANPVESLRTE